MIVDSQSLERMVGAKKANNVRRISLSKLVGGALQTQPLYKYQRWQVVSSEALQVDCAFRASVPNLTFRYLRQKEFAAFLSIIFPFCHVECFTCTCSFGSPLVLFTGDRSSPAVPRARPSVRASHSHLQRKKGATHTRLLAGTLEGLRFLSCQTFLSLRSHAFERHHARDNAGDLGSGCPKFQCCGLPPQGDQRCREVWRRNHD